jgi:hypothetical protein
MLAPCGLNLHFYIFFHGPCAKKFININTKTKKKFEQLFYPHIQPSNVITFQGKPKPKMRQKQI